MRVAIEGLIGTGKSTVLEHLAQDGYRVAYEPLDAWTLLPQFYKDTAKHSLAFELQVVNSYCHENYECALDKILLMERSPDSALWVFAEMLRSTGKLSSEDFALLHFMAHKLPVAKADAFVYLKLPIDECLKRISWRSRESETTSVTKEYLVSLESFYIKFLERQALVHIIDLDVNDGPKQVAEKVKECLIE